MMRILSWSSGLGCDKMNNPDFSVFVPKPQPSSVTDFSLTSAVKRKRTPSCDAQTHDLFQIPANASTIQGDSERTQADALPPTESVIKQEPVSLTDPAISFSPLPMAASQPADIVTQTPSETNLKRMRQVISSQLSLEILVKHKELRLIDQEIAKCQVALEQLRRCSEIPYPGTQHPSILVSEGKGSALRRSADQFPAPSPAPWGVTDGPYSRHYAKWLLPDSRFDGGEPDLVQMQNIMDAAVPARSTRGSFVEAGKTLKSRSIVRGNNFQSLPAGYGLPKEKATGPMVLKRKSDNSMVKLVCPDCGRHDFGSAQGFINHCRIGHGRSFASHDAAAEACGERIEYNDNGTMKGIEPVVTPTTTNMHPLIRSAKLLPQTHVNTPASSRVSDPKSRRTKRTKSSNTSSNFLPSSQTPHLSNLIKAQGLGLNLQDLVTDAKTKVVLPESDAEDDEMEIDSPLPRNSSRHPQVAGSKQPAKSVSLKHHSALSESRLPVDSNTSSLQQRRQPHLTMSAPQVQADFMHPLIPSPTNESTQAPSLVDDDEEFDPQSPASNNEMDDAEIDFDVQDDEHGERVVLRGGEIPSPQTTCVPNSPSRGHTRRASTVKTSLGTRGANKSVNFSVATEQSEGSERKRRRIEEN